MRSEEVDSIIDKLDVSVQKCWNEFASYYDESRCTDQTFWKLLYDLAVVSFNVEFEFRLRVSELAALCRQIGIDRPGDVAVAYAHSMHAIARYQGKEVFGYGFTV